MFRELSLSPAAGRPWVALESPPRWEREGGEFIYKQNESASSRRRKTNGLHFSDSCHWEGPQH